MKIRPMIKYTFTRPLSHPETVALATRSYPIPCVISIVHPIPAHHAWFYMYNEPIGRKYAKPFKWFKFNRARKATAK